MWDILWKKKGRNLQERRKDLSYEKEKRIEEINRKILVSARNELYLHLRFLDVALSTLRYQMDAGTDLSLIHI